MKNIVITGATGFIGSNLVNKLLEDDNNLYLIVRKDSKNLNKLPFDSKIKLVHLSLDEMNKLSSFISVPCDIFYHLAWDGIRGETRNDKELQESNYVNSMTALKEAQKLNCKIFFSAGSQAEYGLYNEKITEETECRPVTEYGKYKYKFYVDALEFCEKENIKFKEPRFFSLYGKGDYEGTMVISIIKKMLKNEDCDLTECVQLWDFLHIRDAIEGLIKLAKCECENGAYNFGNGDSKSLKEFVGEMYRLTNSKSKLNYGKVPYPNNLIINVNPDVTKLKTALNWSPKITFEEGIKEIIEDIKGGTI